MSIGAILIGITMLVVAVPIVIKPLLNDKSIESSNPADSGRDNLGDRHSELLLALRDLDFDHQIGKVTEEDYGAIRETLLVQAATALETKEKQDAELDAQLEQAIQLRREKLSKSLVCSHCGIKLEPTDRFCRVCGTPVEATCPKCGGMLQPNDLFCNNCGAPIVVVKTPATFDGSL